MRCQCDVSNAASFISNAVSQHFNMIQSFVFLFLAHRVHISAATKTMGVVCFRKLTFRTVVKCSLIVSYSKCLSEVNLYMFMQGNSSSHVLHSGGYLATAGLLQMTSITLKQKPFKELVNMKGVLLCASMKVFV